jgi:hypothetical protein
MLISNLVQLIIVFKKIGAIWDNPTAASSSVPVFVAALP